MSVAEEFLALPAEERPAFVAQAVVEGWDGRRAREAVRAQLEPPAPPEPALAPQLTLLEGNLDAAAAEQANIDLERARGVSPRPATAWPSNLAQQAQALNALLKEVRPFELTAADERALAALLETLLGLARAHAGPGRSGMAFPSIEEAEGKARRR